MDPACGASPAVGHLVLDALPPALLGEDAPPPASPAAAAAGARALLASAAAQPRLAVKLAAALQLEASALDPGQQAALVDAAGALLDSPGSAAAGVGLLLQFPPLLAYFHADALLEVRWRWRWQ